MKLLSRFLTHGSVLGILLIVSPAHAATNWLYDLYVTPSALPPAPPFTTVAGGGGDQQTASGALLTLVDTDAITPGFYYFDALDLSIINSGLDYEARSRVRLREYGSTTTGSGLFAVFMDDGTRQVSWGMRFDGVNTEFGFLDATGAISYGATDIAAPTGDDFFNVLMRKTGSTVQLIIDGVTTASVAYASLPTSSDIDVLFGNTSSPAYGRVELTGQSFAIGEAAPNLIPEPSLLALGGFSLLVLARRRARSC